MAIATLVGAAAAQAAPPPNDEIARATPIGALPAVVSGSTVDATVGTDEPSPLVVTADDQNVGIDRTVWFVHTATATGNVLLDSCDSNFDNYVNVFAGSPSALRRIDTRSNPYRGCYGDRLLFAVTKGTRYYVRVAAQRTGSLSPQGGVFRMSLESQTPPANDAFASATVLPGPGTGAFDAPLAFSTVEFGEPTLSDETGSVWFRLTPTQSRPYTVSVPSGEGSVGLAVYDTKGSSLNGLRRLGRSSTGSGDTSPATVTFNALKGQRYVARLATSEAVPSPARLLVTTNTVKGSGFVLDPARNTVGGLRRGGFAATASCTRSCRVTLRLRVGAGEARRRHLYRGKRRPRGPVVIGTLRGSLSGGRSTSVTVPLARGLARRLRGVRTLRVTLEGGITGARRGGTVRVAQTLTR